MPSRLRDIELLEVLGGLSLDARGRIAEHWGATIAAAVDGERLWIGDAVDDALAAELQTVFAATQPAGDPTEAPQALGACASLLANAGGPVLRTRSPCFSFPERLPAVDSGAVMRRSTEPDVSDLRSANPGGWEADEWDDLLDGTLGPWAFATVDGRVVSICHTPRAMTAEAAEAGVWTRPEFRGRGHARASTAAWAQLLQPSGRHLFYCTDEDNHASRNVAAKLGLRPIGWTWGLSRLPDPNASASSRHPLSRPR